MLLSYTQGTEPQSRDHAYYLKDKWTKQQIICFYHGNWSCFLKGKCWKQVKTFQSISALSHFTFHHTKLIFSVFPTSLIITYKQFLLELISKKNRCISENTILFPITPSTKTIDTKKDKRTVYNFVFLFSLASPLKLVSGAGGGGLEPEKDQKKDKMLFRKFRL